MTIIENKPMDNIKVVIYKKKGQKHPFIESPKKYWDAQEKYGMVIHNLTALQKELIIDFMDKTFGNYEKGKSNN